MASGSELLGGRTERLRRSFDTEIAAAMFLQRVQDDRRPEARVAGALTVGEVVDNWYGTIVETCPPEPGGTTRAGSAGTSGGSAPFSRMTSRETRVSSGPSTPR
jgi:hypothetical protein